MRHATIAFLALGLVALLCGQAAAVRIDRDFHESFDVEEGFRLLLRSGDGDVAITPWEKDAIDVTVRYLADINRVGLGDSPDFEVEFEEGDDYVRVVGQLTPAGPSVFKSSRVHEYTYTIKAPPYVELEIDGDDGAVEVTGWRGRIDFDVDDGDVYLDDIKNTKTSLSVDDGDVTVLSLVGGFGLSGDDGDVSLSGCVVEGASLNLDDGDVMVRESSGDFAISLDDGDVSLDLVSASSVSVRADDGDVDVAIESGATEEVNVNTDDGNVMVSMSPESAYSFGISVDNGGVRIDLTEVGEMRKDEHSASGVVRGGGGRVRITTDDGDVMLVES